VSAETSHCGGSKSGRRLTTRFRASERSMDFIEVVTRPAKEQPSWQ